LENKQFSYTDGGDTRHYNSLGSLVSGPWMDDAGFAVATDIVEDLKRRNQKPVPLEGFGFRSPTIRVVDPPDPADAGLGTWWKSHGPEAPKAKVSVWLPGYARDGRSAVICFVFAPTPHGAHGVYLLEKRADGGWIVIRRRIGYGA